MPTTIADELQKRIQKKQQEISELKEHLREAEVYLQALLDLAKYAPKERIAAATGVVSIRPGSTVARAREALRKHGKPMHVVELLTAKGIPTDRNAKSGLSGSLSPYVRQQQVFTRPAPNTFGLAEFPEEPVPGGSTPPATFGKQNGAVATD